MRIVHLSTYDINGGAARASYRLHKGLLGLGHDSSMLVAERRSEDPSVVTFRPPMDFPSRLRRRVRREEIARGFADYRKSRPKGYELFSDDRSEHADTLVNQIRRCDIVNLHWVSGFVDYQAFFAALPRTVPIVWTLHDMNAFTGGCHYDHGCGKYTGGCGACPQLGSSRATDISNQIWQRKRKTFELVEPRRLHIVTPSRWLAREVERSPLLSRFPLTVIPYGVDTDDFAPRDRGCARDVLEIPRGARVVLFVADSVTERRKGFAMLAQALSGPSDLDDLFLISLGYSKPEVAVSVPHLHLGAFGKDRWLSLAYSAADVFVIPSLQDNLPNTMLEATACGTPVVGFAVGGVPDVVRPGVTGMTVPAQDVSALRRAVIELLQNQARLTEMSTNCRRNAVEKYSLETQARRYIDLYEEVIQFADNTEREHPRHVRAAK